MEVLTIVLLGVVMLVGLGGTIIPVLPGLLMIWGAGLVYGLLTGFDVTWTPFALMSVMMVAGYGLGFALPGMTGAKAGAPLRTLVLGALGAVAGFVLIPVLGLPLGAVGGVYMAELQRLGDGPQAWKSTKAVLIGMGLSVAVEVLFAVAMIVTWVVWLFQ